MNLVPPSTDQQKRAKPVGSYKQDFFLYSGAGSGGAGLLTATNTQQYSYFVDYSNFDVYIREVVIQNSSFQIYTDGGGLTTVPLYFGVQNSNDRPTSDIIAKAPGAGLKFTTAPPYNIDIKNLVQPFGGTTTVIGVAGQTSNQLVDGAYFYDQGGYIYPQVNIGGLYGRIYGNNNKIVQSFVPQSNKILNIAIGGLWMDGSQNLTDHTIYSDIIIEVWDSNKNVIYTQTISRFATPLSGSVPSTYPYTWKLLDWEHDTLADDGKLYWDSMTGIKLQPTSPIQVSPGQTYYLVFKPATNGTVNRYGVSTNAVGGIVDTVNRGQYINGTLYAATYSSTTLVPIQANEAVGFATTRPNGRFCITAAWDNSAYFWHNPLTSLNQIKPLKVDTDRRI